MHRPQNEAGAAAGEIVKLTDLIKPHHVMAAYAKFERMAAEDRSSAVEEHLLELMPISRVVALTNEGSDFALTMTAISIIDLAIQEATAEKLT